MSETVRLLIWAFVIWWGGAILAVLGSIVDEILDRMIDPLHKGNLDIGKIILFWPLVLFINIISLPINLCLLWKERSKR